MIMAPPADVEFSGAAGGDVSAYSRVPAAGLAGAARAAGSHGTDGPGYTDLKGSLNLRGSLLQDSARFGLTVAGRQGDVPVSAEWPAIAAGSALADLVRDRTGADVTARQQPGVLSDNAVSGMAHLGWHLSSRHSLQTTVAGAILPEAVTAAGGPVGSRLEDGTDMIAGAALRSAFGSTTNHLRASFGRSTRTSVDGTLSSAGAGGDADMPPVLVVSDGLRFGAVAPYSATETTIRVSDAIELHSGRNSIKAGGALQWSTFDHTNAAGTAGQFLFGNVAQLDAGIGAYERRVGGAPSVTWDVPRLAVFAQNRWTSPIGADLTVGFRVEQQSIRPGQIPVDQEFLTLTGLASNRVPAATWQISPRLNARWDLANAHDWVFQASAGVFHDRVDPLLISSWLTDNGTAEVHEQVGDLGGWPDGEPAGTRTARRLSLLDGDIRGPQSARVSGGVARSLGDIGVVELSGVYRDTRFLPRSRDINLIPSAVASDMYGRAIYGELSQHAELLVPVPGTNRRFTSYDEVAALSADGRARYWGISLGAQLAPAGGVSLLARYTFSHATDDWFGGRTGGWRMPGPGALPGADKWIDGRSDFDAPHRAVAALRIAAPMGLQLSGIYRFESGRPFTPGFQDGVDANGDGYAGNDPAFVDASLPGVADLTAQWSCLQAGTFSERNACRADATHTFDARAELALLRGTGFGAAVVVEALNLIDSQIALPDPALYIVDPDGSTVVEPDGTVAVPLIANPNFGQARAGAFSGRMLRIGISLNW
jgi:hypothetical protein